MPQFFFFSQKVMWCLIQIDGFSGFLTQLKAKLAQQNDNGITALEQQDPYSNFISY